ncbi:ATP-dependent RNA helicase ddx18, partial [Goodea atripinnis]
TFCHQAGSLTVEVTPAVCFCSGAFEDTSFASLAGLVSDNTLRGVKEMGFEHMTEIQHKTIRPLLDGRYTTIFGSLRSMNSLLSLLPPGTGVVILSPTRELAMQTYGVMKELMAHHVHTYGLIMGGSNRSAEAQRLANGVNILVATPGRLLDHLQFSSCLNDCSSQPAHFVSEHPRIHVQEPPVSDYRRGRPDPRGGLRGGAEADHQAAAQCVWTSELPSFHCAAVILVPLVSFKLGLYGMFFRVPAEKRQTMLFSATQTRRVEDLARISLKKEPLYVGVDDNKDSATVDGLEQGYVVCPSEKRFLLLFTFLKKNRKKKLMVFFSSCMSVKFHYELLNYIDLPVMAIHGKQKQTKRTTTFFQFCNADSGILLCTDVAARGLDIPEVDWIVQYDPPDDPKEYIHRVGRTARGIDGRGHALLILRPEELGFLRFLKHAKVMPQTSLCPVSCCFSLVYLCLPALGPTERENLVSTLCPVPQLEKLIEKNYYLHKSAQEAYKSYVRAYDSHSLKQIYSVNTLNLPMVALSFGFQVPPYVDLSILLLCWSSWCLSA